MIIGIDFGTTNTRIATWEPGNKKRLPELKKPNKLGLTTMPSVISFLRKSGGGFEVEYVGEEADNYEDTKDRIVIRNIKRWALTSDPFVRKLLESRIEKEREVQPPPNWDPIKRTIGLWGNEVPVSTIISEILKRALKESGLDTAKCDVKVACPVDADLAYRKDLVEAISQLGFTSKVSWVTEEPLRFLELCRYRNYLTEGSYLIYDFGGGSFDCAIVTVEKADGEVKLVVRCAEGDPLLGGTNIDDKLASRLKYIGGKASLRQAKEALCQSQSKQSQPLVGGVKLTMDDLRAVFDEGRYFDRTLQIVMSVYRQAKIAWKRSPNGPPIGNILEENKNHEIIRQIFNLTEQDLAHDIDKVILFGGTTKIPFVMEQLKQIFGASKVISASELMLSGESASFGELELTGVALGASCSLDPQFSAFYVNRIPCRLILSTKQGSQIQECEYSPFSRLPLYPATTPFVSNALELQNNLAAQYKIVMEDVDDVILYDTGWKDAKMPTYGAPARKMRIILDRFGRVFPQMITGNNDMVTEMLQPKDWIPQMDAPPWQTPDHREALNKLMDHLLQFQKTEYERLVFMVHRNPWGWGEDVG